VQKVVTDPERDSFIVVMVKPAAHLERLDEVLIITSTEPRFPANAQQDMATSQALKGPEAAALQDQLKASQIMAEHLPGLTDPGAAGTNPELSPGAVQPGQATPGQAAPAAAATPPPPPKLLPALHPDRFSPAAALAPSAKPSDPNTTPPQAPASQPSAPRRNP